MNSKLIWAIDMSGDQREEQKYLLPLIEIFAKYLKGSAKPLFVFNRQSLGSDISVFARVYGVEVNDLARAVFKNFIDKNRPSWLEPGHLLISETYTRRGMIKDLMGFAHQEGASMIITFSRMRSKHWPGFLGGFTESLLLASDLPILTAHPGGAVPERIQHVLYPCRLDVGDEEKFLQAVSFAKSQGARLTLFFNQSSLEREYADFPQFLTSKDYQLIIENRKQTLTSKETRAAGMIERAIEEGVDSRFFAATDTVQVTESILQYAAENAVDLIIMASKAGSFEGLVFGSTTREVIRQAKCPVWALHAAA